MRSRFANSHVTVRRAPSPLHVPGAGPEHTISNSKGQQDTGRDHIRPGTLFGSSSTEAARLNRTRPVIARSKKLRSAGERRRRGGLLAPGRAVERQG